MKLEYYKGKMAENDNQYTVDKQRKVEEETSFMLEPLRDNVVFWHYFNTFFNTLHPLKIHLKFSPGKRHLFPIFTL